MESNGHVSFTSLKISYAKYVSAIIEEAMVDKFGNNAFSQFDKWAKEQADEQNDKREKKNKDKSSVSSITKGLYSFKDFDWQACNRTFAFLKNAYEVVYDYYKIEEIPENISKNEQKKYARYQITQINNDMVPLRNISSHESGGTEIQAMIEAQLSAAQCMRSMLEKYFPNVTDENGNTYASLFAAESERFVEQVSKSWYFLSDYLDSSKYDFSRFPIVCATNVIECKLNDGRYMFKTSRIEQDLQILKNNLLINSEQHDAFNQKQETVKKAKVNTLIISLIIATIFVGMVVVLISKLPMLKREDNNSQQDTTYNSSVGVVGNENDTSTNENDTSTTKQPFQQESTTSQLKQNTIPEEHESLVTTLKYSDKQRLSLMTIKVKVGEYIAPPCASTWRNGTIYSENTDIAVGEEMLVKGVSVGETYIVYENEMGMGIAYRVIVK